MVATVVLPGTDVETEVTVVRGWLVGVDPGTEDTVVARGWLVATEVAEVAEVAGGWLVATDGGVVATVVAVVAGVTTVETKAGGGALSTDWAAAMTIPPK